MFSVVPFNSAYADAVTDTIGPEYAIFPAYTMNVNQLAYESYSHNSQNAIDILPNGDVFAPFTGEVIYTDSAWGYVVLQSTSKVFWADGSFDYMTVGFMHDNDISDIEVGDVFEQGQDFYQAGGTAWGNPNCYGAHVHIAVFRGEVKINNSDGGGNEYAYDAFFISNKTNDFSGKGRGYIEKGNIVSNDAPDDYSDKWRSLDYLDKCNIYCSCGTVEITEGTYIKSLPCSKKTNKSSADILKAKKGTTYAVNGLYVNSVGNYWYRITFDDQYGFVFAGDTCFYNCDLLDLPGNSYFSVTGYDLYKYDNGIVRTIRLKWKDS